MASRISIKKELALKICEAPYTSLKDVVSQYDTRDLINPLFSYICNSEEILKWRAVTCFGIVVPLLAEDDMESSRIIMRRFLWSLNDESGGIGWGAPEAMSEIMCHQEQLRDEYLHILISYMRGDGEELFQDGNFLELPMLQQGLLWGVGRVAIDSPLLLVEKGVIEDVNTYLNSEDLIVVALALRCLTLLGEDVPTWAASKYSQARCKFNLYENGLIKLVKIQNFL